jgi:phosphoglycolate phosphatase-like HAD superfamily hydrolase
MVQGSTTMDTLVLFDIDGTLIRAGTEVHRAAFAHAFRTIYGRDLSLDGISAAGRTDTWLLYEPLRRAGLGSAASAALASAAFEAMATYVDAHLGDLRDRVLPGVPQTLAELHRRGAILGLLTGNLERIARVKLRHAGLEGYFDTGAFGEASATRADLVPVALAAAGRAAGAPIPAYRCVVVGDTPLDVEAGKAHGTRVCAVATGPFDVAVLRATRADLVLRSLADPIDSAARIMELAPRNP